MNELAFKSISELLTKLENKEISSLELLNFFIERFKKFDKKIGSALEIFDEESIIKSSKSKGILNNIPGLVKDVICQKNRITSCASKMLKNFKPNYDATVISRLKNEGAFLIGRANCDEFAMGVSNENSAFWTTKNPWDLKRTPGGSSGGSAAAVAAGLIPWSLGSDTGGSVRMPAMFCGVVGLKPTYGLVSRYGLIAYASSLDQVGVLTRTVRDSALLLSVIAGHDLKDSSSLSVDKKDYTKGLNGKLNKGLKIGVLKDLKGLNPEVELSIQQAVKLFESLGAKIIPVSMPSLEYGAASYFVISRAEAASNLARFDGVFYGSRFKNADNLKEMYEKTRGAGFGIEVKRRIIIGNYVLSAGHADDFYSNARIVQQLIRKDFFETYKKVDLLLSPISPIPAFKLGEFENNKFQMDLLDYFTCPINLAGVPAIAVPCGLTKKKLPIGFQLVGPHLSEGLLLKTAYAYEQNTPWHKYHPELED